jgi:hypothetical protein
MSLNYVCIDVLHALDLGVTQDAVGNILYAYIQSGLVVGRTFEARVRQVWLQLLAHYKQFRTPNRLQNLTVEMVRKQGKPPKLRAKGAETKGVVPFAVEVAMEMHAKLQTHVSLTMVQCISALLDFYMLLTCPDWHAEAAGAACRKFCTLYGALNKNACRQGDELSWRIKPKMHLFIELAEFPAPLLGNPSNFWAYADEDFVGWIAQLAASRGGPSAASTTARKTLERYAAIESL